MTNKKTQDTDSQKSSSLKTTVLFFVLTFVLSIPFMVISAITKIEIMPGLPIAAICTICPMLAALILVYREDKKAGVVRLLQRSFDYKRIKARAWYLPILLLMPVVMIISFFIIRLIGIAIPAPVINVFSTLILCVIFFIGALGEELGWSGYAIDPMQKSMGALPASLALGIIWAVYHYVGLAEVNRSVVWILWWSLGSIAIRVIMVWIFNNSGKSVFAMALFHMTINVTWQLFPVSGSYYNPKITGLVLTLVTVCVMTFYDPKTFLWKKANKKSK